MIITQTPLRISFSGGGTDFPEYYRRNQGFVVSAAIDKYVFVFITGRYDKKIYVNYSKKEIVDSVDEISHELVREAMRITGITEGVEVSMISDIPSEGSGLGSSSSITVGLLNAFYIFMGEQVGPERLAEEACEVEIVRCKKPIGKQDQYIASFGGMNSFVFNRDDTVDVNCVKLSSSEMRNFTNNIYLYFTGQTRQASSILGEQNGRVEQNSQVLENIKQLGCKAYEDLTRRNYDSIGRVLDLNWKLKKELAENITNNQIEKMHKIAMSAGATGAKICGAGGGGFMMVYCPSLAHENLKVAMKDYKEMPIEIEPDGSKVIFNYRRSSWI